MDPQIQLLALILSKVNLIYKQGVIMTQEVAALQAKMATMQQALDAREARDVAQDAVKAQQIQTLQDNIATLQAAVSAGNLGADDLAGVNSVIASLDASIAILNAADNAPPDVPAVTPDPTTPAV